MNIPTDVDKTIRNWISEFETSNTRKQMEYGKAYYRSENTEIMNRRMMIYTENEDGVPMEMEDPYKANNKLASGFFKLLVDQKLNYSLGKKITFDTKQAEELEELLTKKFQQKLKKIAKEAAKKSVGWAHVYIDKEGDFKIASIPSEQIIPLYSEVDSEEMEAVVRYYTVTEDGQSVNRVEVWDNEQVTYYQQKGEGGSYYLLPSEKMCEIFGRPSTNPRYHLYKSKNFGKTKTETTGIMWGAIPFVPLFNNDEDDTDLQAIKNYIDVYDIVDSDFANNFEDFQDMYWILKGYNGENVGKFLEQVKRYKTIKVGDEGDAKAEKMDVPADARIKELNNLENKIFEFGQGVNLNQTGSGNITNVVIRARFANLDLKANGFEMEVEEFMEKLMYFVNKYREFNRMEPIELDSITFNRSIIVNEEEMLKANSEQMGVTGESTRLSNHPWVDDPEEEIRVMEQERNARVDLDDVVIEDEE